MANGRDKLFKNHEKLESQNKFPENFSSEINLISVNFIHKDKIVCIQLSTEIPIEKRKEFKADLINYIKENYPANSIDLKYGPSAKIYLHPKNITDINFILKLTDKLLALKTTPNLKIK